MTGRKFLLARQPPLNTTLIDEATGLAVYKVETPEELMQSITKIRKLDPPIQPPTDWVKGEGPNSDTGTAADIALPDEMARIYWKSDSINFRGRVAHQSEFLPTSGKLGGSFALTGPDGVQYRWAMGSMGMNYPKLVTADDRKIVIAEYSSEHHFTKKRTARLEVQQSGMHMLDYIILTFIFVEYQRKVRKDAVNDSAAYA